MVTDQLQPARGRERYFGFEMSPEQALSVVFPRSLPKAESREQLIALETFTLLLKAEGQRKRGEGSRRKNPLGKCSLSRVAPLCYQTLGAGGLGRQRPWTTHLGAGLFPHVISFSLHHNLEGEGVHFYPHFTDEKAETRG